MIAHASQSRLIGEFKLVKVNPQEVFVGKPEIWFVNKSKTEKTAAGA